MKEIKLIPLIDASDFTEEVDEEFAINEISTHYQHDLIFLDWEEDDLPVFKEWLITEYGQEIKQYKQFAIIAT